MNAWALCRSPQSFVKEFPAPPDCNSRTFRAELSEVRRISDTRTPKQLEIAQFWAGNPGTPTPPGIWNKIASKAIKQANIKSAKKAAYILQVLNAAQFDASRVAWAFKYKYWSIRPSQADPAITTPIGLPNFPCYISGHSTFSAASATVLSAFFPNSKDEFRQLAKQAGISRIYGGIHFPSDNRTGLAVGKAVAQDVLTAFDIKGKAERSKTA